MNALLSLIAGGLLPLAFAPFHITGLAFISPMLLLFQWLNSTPRQALWRGFLFGLAAFTAGTYWIFISIHHFGGSNVVLSLSITALFVSTLAACIALQGWLFRILFRHKPIWVQALLAFPLLWVAIEWLRSTVLNGFPWLLLGSSQQNTLLASLAPIVGEHGLTAIVALFAGCVALLCRRQWRWAAIIILTGVTLIASVLNKHHWTHPLHHPLKITVIQGNIAKNLKWNPEYAAQTLKTYRDLTLPHHSSQLIVWPEGAMPVFPSNASLFVQQMQQWAIRKNTSIIFGAPLKNQKKYFNGLMQLGHSRGVYYKRHLVPFGEYTPLRSVFAPLADALNIPMSDFNPGPAKQPFLQVDGIPTAAFICYEIAFSNEVLEESRHSQLIVTVSDDGWFGKSIAQAQQFQMTQLRALETGRPIVVATTTGISGFIDDIGQVIQQLPAHTTAVDSVTLYPRQGQTPLMRIGGNRLLMIMMGMLLVAALWPRNPTLPARPR